MNFGAQLTKTNSKVSNPLKKKKIDSKKDLNK